MTAIVIARDVAVTMRDFSYTGQVLENQSEFTGLTGPVVLVVLCALCDFLPARVVSIEMASSAAITLPTNAIIHIAVVNEPPTATVLIEIASFTLFTFIPRHMIDFTVGDVLHTLPCIQDRSTITTPTCIVIWVID